ncbi:MAG: hypothetical protein SFZ24_11890 [Planctomycetota bacterium]|nr:hypothetical protein [Planctomycetota bacterium]
MEVELVTTMTQFGMAGLVGWMWLVERRAAAARETQLVAAHERLMEQRVQLDALLRVVAENTRAVASVEAGQRALGAAIEALAGVRRERVQ